jgi:hypothetical protein
MHVALASLWLPIVLSAITVFVVSSLIWMVIQWHNADWQELPDEDKARAALRGTPPGQYSVPHAADGKARQQDAWQAKFKEGPVAMLVVLPQGDAAMGRQLIYWLAYTLVLSTLIAYVAGTTLTAGTDYLKVFQVTSTVGVLAYAGNAATGAIWFGHTWSRTLKDIVDGLVYALATAGIFGWLWP